MDYTTLSKEISYVLRHSPEEYGLVLDEDGWVSLDKLINILRWNDKWESLDKSDIEEMILISPRKRHEVLNNKIRAFYGHSLQKKIIKDKLRPPQFLYHGTTSNAVENIMLEGLKPCSRQYVHLSIDIETAVEVGKRRDREPVVLIINAQEAYGEGTEFYLGNEQIWLVDKIESKFINKL